MIKKDWLFLCTIFNDASCLFVLVYLFFSNVERFLKVKLITISLSTGFDDVLQIENALERMFSDKYNDTDLVSLSFTKWFDFQNNGKMKFYFVVLPKHIFVQLSLLEI
jgi:hypothetical protein